MQRMLLGCQTVAGRISMKRCAASTQLFYQRNKHALTLELFWVKICGCTMDLTESAVFMCGR